MSALKTPVSRPEARQVPPGPRGIPLLGNALQLGGTRIVHQYINWWKEYGDIYHLKLGPLDAYILSSPEYVHHVLVKNQRNYIKGIGYDGLRLLLGNGLVTSDGETWRQDRRVMQPPFTPTAIVQFMDMMVEVTQRMLDRWRPTAEQGQRLRIDDEMMRLTMSIIGRALFSIDLGEELMQVGDALREVFAFVPERFSNPLSLPLSAPLPKHRRFRQNMQIIEDFIQKRIEEGRRGGQDNLLSILLRARDEETGYQMSAGQLRDEVVTLFFAGFETTARSLTWGWHLLGRHPEVMRKIEVEVDQQLGGRLPTTTDLYNLVYTRMTVDEVLRIYPPTAVLARQTVAEDEIGGYCIPAGALVVLAPYLVHRYPGVWDDPERFDPGRFTPESVARIPKNAYIPFASGPRVCLGNNFALLEMTLAFAMAAGRYRLEPVVNEEIPFEFSGTIRPTKPLWMRVSVR